MKREYYVTPKSGKIMRLFWKAAGGDRYLLERATYADQIKYMCLGGIVVATGLMAGLAGGYAFYTIFSPKTANVLDKTKIISSVPEAAGNVANNPSVVDSVKAISNAVVSSDYIPTDIPTVLLSIVFGIIWGLIIFNIDRFIVTSTGKGDGTEAITWEEFKSAIPRIIMGIIIAISISKPVEIRMFKTEIDLEVKKQQDIEKENVIAQATINYEKKVAEPKNRLLPFNNQIEAKRKRIYFLDSMISYETFHGGCRDKCEENKKERDLAKIEIETIKANPDYVAAIEDIRRFDEDKKKAMAEAEKKAATLDGLLIRIQKAHELSPMISIFITLLFLAIELTPIFFKLMLIKTPYDYMEENVKELIKAENGIEVRYDYYKDKKGQERHLVIHHEVERLIYEKIKATEAQKSLIDHAVDKYISEQKIKIDANPGEYITTEKNGSAA